MVLGVRFPVEVWLELEGNPLIGVDWEELACVRVRSGRTRLDISRIGPANEPEPICRIT